MNVTGLKSLNQLTLAQETIERKLQQQVDNVRIDNTFYSQKNFANVDLRQVYAFMKKVTHLMWNIILNYLLECIFTQKKSLIQQSYFS